MAANLAYDLFGDPGVANVSLSNRVSTGGDVWSNWHFGAGWNVNSLSLIARDNLTDDAPKGVRYPPGGAGPCRGNVMNGVNFAPYNTLRADVAISRVTPAVARGACGVGFICQDNLVPANPFRGIAFGISWVPFPLFEVALYVIHVQTIQLVAVCLNVADVAPFTDVFSIELTTANSTVDPYTITDYSALVYKDGVLVGTFPPSTFSAALVPRLSRPFIFAGDENVGGLAPPLDYMVSCAYQASGSVSIGGPLLWQPLNERDYQYSTTLDFSIQTSYAVALETTFDGNRRERIRTLILSTENATAPVNVSLNGVGYQIPASRELIIPAPDALNAVFVGSSGQLLVKGFTMPRDVVLTYQRES